MLASEVDRGDHVGRRRTPRDRGRVAVDPGIPHPACLVESCIAGDDDSPVHVGAQFCDVVDDRVRHI